MKRIEAIEKLIEKSQNEEITGKEFYEKINPTFYWAYKNAKEYSHNSMLDFNEVIWDRDIEAIVNHCKEFGIKAFTISSEFSNLIATLAEFEKQGCSMAGIVKVNAVYKDWETGELNIIPAILMTVN